MAQDLAAEEIRREVKILQTEIQTAWTRVSAHGLGTVSRRISEAVFVYDITVVVHALVYLYVYSDTIQGKCRPLLFPKEQFVKSIWDKYNRMEVFCGVARVQAIAK